MSTAKALLNVVGYERRRHNVRINRRLDDRDNILFEALAILEGRSSAVYPTVQEFPATLTGPSDGAGAVTGIALAGVNLLGDATKSAGNSSGSTGQLDLEAVLPGAQDITVTFTDTGAALAVSAADVSAGTIDIVHGDGGGAGTAGVYTVAEVLAVINAHATAKFMVEASEGTAGDMETDETILVTGGTGVVPVFSIGSAPMDGSVAGNGITAMDDTSITLDLDVSGGGHGLTIGDTYLVSLSIDGVDVPMPFSTIVA